ncbi:MAG: hypothetical protein MUC82_11480, partial [Cypionkella sp.]|nr:hypothetical protein [Cypionkella sp.]
MMHMSPKLSPAFDQLKSAAADRILVLDGAMGTQIQALGFGEAEFTAHGAGCQYLLGRAGHARHGASSFSAGRRGARGRLPWRPCGCSQC